MGQNLLILRTVFYDKSEGRKKTFFFHKKVFFFCLLQKKKKPEWDTLKHNSTATQVKPSGPLAWAEKIKCLPSNVYRKHFALSGEKKKHFAIRICQFQVM